MTQMITLPEDAARVQVFWASAGDCYFTAKTVSAVLDVADQTLANWRVSGGGPKFVKRGRILYYRKEDVVAWLKAPWCASVERRRGCWLLPVYHLRTRS